MNFQINLINLSFVLMGTYRSSNYSYPLYDDLYLLLDAENKIFDSLLDWDRILWVEKSWDYIRRLRER